MDAALLSIVPARKKRARRFGPFVPWSIRRAKMTLARGRSGSRPTSGPRTFDPMALKPIRWCLRGPNSAYYAKSGQRARSRSGTSLESSATSGR